MKQNGSTAVGPFFNFFKWVAITIKILGGVVFYIYIYKNNKAVGGGSRGSSQVVLKI